MHETGTNREWSPDENLFNLLHLTNDFRECLAQLFFRGDGVEIAPERIIAAVRLIRKNKIGLQGFLPWKFNNIGSIDATGGEFQEGIKIVAGEMVL
jgi:hypothetical protein